MNNPRLFYYHAQVKKLIVTKFPTRNEAHNAAILLTRSMRDAGFTYDEIEEIVDYEREKLEIHEHEFL